MFSILRITLIILVSFALAVFLPVLPGEFNSHLISTVALVVLYGLFIGFFINSARERWGKLSSNIASELSRARRVHHIVNELSLIDTERSNKVKTAIVNYLAKFKEIDFNDYEKTNFLFRKVTKPVYSFAKIEHPHEIALYKELLTSLRDWALFRQFIASGLKHQLSRIGWLILSISAVLPTGALFLTRLISLPSKLVAGGSVVMVFLALELLYETEKISGSERNSFTKHYIKNIERLEEK